MCRTPRRRAGSAPHWERRLDDGGIPNAVAEARKSDLVRRHRTGRARRHAAALGSREPHEE
jgi:hypothetical protein